MVDIPFTSYPFAATGGQVSRTMPARLADVISVKEYGALGNGINDDTGAIQSALSAAYGTVAAPHGTANRTANKSVIFPSGHYLISSPLLIPPVIGARIVGSGSSTTAIENTTANGSVIKTDGFCYSHLEGLGLKSNGTGTCLWLGDTGRALVPSVQSNSFVNMSYEGGDYGVQCGADGLMGSEFTFINNSWANHTQGGLVTSNYNALQETVIGGRFVNCRHGIWCWAGSLPVIVGVCFAGSGIDDIRTEGGAFDGFYVAGCRSTSTNFLSVRGAVSFVLNGIEHLGLSNGYFVENLGCQVNIKNCHSSRGEVYSIYRADFKIQNSWFERTDWYRSEDANLWWDAQVEQENLTIGTAYALTQIKRRRGTRDYALA
jgi:pectate lyase-like protein